MEKMTKREIDKTLTRKLSDVEMQKVSSAIIHNKRTRSIAIAGALALGNVQLAAYLSLKK